jgi:hypothetical protein
MNLRIRELLVFYREEFRFWIEYFRGNSNLKQGIPMTQTYFNGLGVHLGNLAQLSGAVTRSISAENSSGAKGQGGVATEGTGAVAARELGRGWKVSPSIDIKGGSTVVLADIVGPGAIQHIWMTVHPRFWRSLILRFYWDNEAEPSVLLQRLVCAKQYHFVAGGRESCGRNEFLLGNAFP